MDDLEDLLGLCLQQHGRPLGPELLLGPTGELAVSGRVLLGAPPFILGPVALDRRRRRVEVVAQQVVERIRFHRPIVAFPPGR